MKANKKAWAQVGAVPFTKKCLENPKVRHDGTDERDPLFDVFRDIQQQNEDLLIGQEIGDRKKRVANLEKERKKRLDFF